MFFIFGIGHQKRTDFGHSSLELCPNCHNRDFGHLHKVSKWFTLFFIPVFPYSTKYLKTCSICGYNEEVHKGDFPSLEGRNEER